MASYRNVNQYRTTNHCPVQGNTALKPLPQRDLRQSSRRKVRLIHNKSQGTFISIGYAIFLCCALILILGVLLNYLKLQAETTRIAKHITQLEEQLYEMQKDNDDEYHRIMSSVDLNEIRRIAIEELGMSYPTEDQIIFYDGRSHDYVRQYEDIPMK